MTPPRVQVHVRAPAHARAHVHARTLPRVMAGLDPAIHTPAIGSFGGPIAMGKMAGSSPAMTQKWCRG